MIDFYIYLHCKPNGDPFYVGKGFGYRSHKFSTRNLHHKNIVAKCGGKQNIEILVFPRDSEQQAFDDEVRWIQVLRTAGYDLANKTAGGDGIHGFRHSAETRAKQSSAAMGRKHTPETIAKVSANNKAGTPEVRAKMSAAKKGRHLSEETRSKLSLSQRGKKRSPLSEETKQKLRLINQGKTYSQETREKVSAAVKAIWAERKSILMQCQVHNEGRHHVD